MNINIRFENNCPQNNNQVEKNPFSVALKSQNIQHIQSKWNINKNSYSPVLCSSSLVLLARFSSSHIHIPLHFFFRCLQFDCIGIHCGYFLSSQQHKNPISLMSSSASTRKAVFVGAFHPMPIYYALHLTQVSEKGFFSLCIKVLCRRRKKQTH